MEKMITVLRFFEYPLTAFAILIICPVVGWIIENVTTILNRIMLKLTGKNAVSILINRFTIVGVIHHELSHAFLAFITGAKVEKIELYKPINNTLGSVSYYPRGPWYMQAIQHTMSAIAPVLCGFISLVCIYKYVTEEKANIPIWGIGLMVYLGISILFHMRLSDADIKNMKKGFVEVLLLLIIIVACFKFSILDFFM